MKRFICLAFLLLTACAGKPPVTVTPPAPAPSPAPAPVQPSRLGILDDSTGYVGGCFAGFFRPQTKFKPDGSTAWVMIDPYDSTGEIQFDGRHLILKRVSSSGNEEQGGVHDRYTSKEADLKAELDYTMTGTDEEGTHVLEGTLTISTADWHEALSLEGQSSCF